MISSVSSSPTGTDGGEESRAAGAVP
jgi:hypothetical protein